MFSRARASLNRTPLKALVALVAVIYTAFGVSLAEFVSATMLDGAAGKINVNSSLGVSSSTPFAKISVGADGAITTTEKTLTDGATIAIDWRDGNQQRVTLGGNRTITMSGYIAGQILRLVVCQDGTGSRTLTWPAAVVWAGGSAPTLTTTASKCDVLTFLATDATGSLKIFGGSVLNF